MSVQISTTSDLLSPVSPLLHFRRLSEKSSDPFSTRIAESVDPVCTVSSSAFLSPPS
jgi:hypothetical protein